MKQKIGQKDVLHAFAHLPPETLAKLHELLRVQAFAAGEQVFAQGVMSSAFYIVAKGQVKITRMTPKGHESIVRMREPGEFFCPVATPDGGMELGTAVALTEAMALWAERESFVNLCHESPELLVLVQDACLSKVRHLIQRLLLAPGVIASFAAPAVSAPTPDHWGLHRPPQPTSGKGGSGLCPKANCSHRTAFAHHRCQPTLHVYVSHP